MAGDSSFMDKLNKMPKWLLVSIGFVLVVGLGYGMYYLVFGMNKKPVDDTPMTVSVDMPDAQVADYDRTRMQAYRDGENSRRSVEDYWDSLDDDLLTSGERSSSGTGLAGEPDPLLNGEYSEMEIYYIRNGLKTKQEIDEDHARRKAYHESLSGGGAYSPQKPMTQEQKDSAYFARMEKAYAIAMKYQQSAGGGAAAATAAQEQAEEDAENERRLPEEPEPSLLPMDSFENDGIITSLESTGDNQTVNYSGTAHSKPVKATFLKDEKISNGQRVIIRLMEDMTLQDGTLIPANQHITGICEFGKRLKINITTLHYRGRMFPVDISVYDNDGTEGIYCPMVESVKKKERQAKKVASDALSTVGSAVGMIVSGNPFVGRIASSGLTAATSSVNSDGSVSVNVNSGYEFYIFENYKEKK